MSRDHLFSSAPYLDDVRLLVQESFADFFEREVPSSRVRAADATHGVDDELWRAFADLGGPQVSLPEDLGGGGGSFLDAVLIGVECGRVLAPIPYAESVSSSRLLALTGSPGSDFGSMRAVIDGSPGVISNTLVPAGAAASELLVVRADGVDAYDERSSGIRLEPVDNLGGLPLARVDATMAVVSGSWSVAPVDILRWRNERRLLAASVLLGAGQRAFALSLGHVLERRQFGRVIGSFQALQHRLADHATKLAAAQLLVLRAARDMDTSLEKRGAAAATALSWTIRATETAAKDALQLFGGYGYTLEFDVHLYLRFIKAYGVLARDPELSGDVVARRIDGICQETAGGRDAARSRIAEFRRLHASDDAIERAWASGTVHDAEIHRALGREGLIGMTWPTEFGGAATNPVEAGQLWEAMNYHRLPVDLLELTEMVAHVLVEVGSSRQQTTILPQIRDGSLLISLGYSEPDAGSDVAAATTRAVRDGDQWRISGAKMFTTGAHVADLIFVLARSDMQAGKHAGLSLFLVPRRTTGVTVSPVHTFGGERTNAVFFDDVRVDEDALVGEAGAGWAILNTALDFERQVMAAYSGQAERLYDDLVAALETRGRLHDPTVRALLADYAVALAAARELTEDVGHRGAAALPIDVCAAMAKLSVTEVLKELSYVALDLVGDSALVVPGPLEHWFRHAQISTIYGGSNEIQREIIAKRGLGLPRS